MGRKKRYDREELIARATALFRTHGYAGTSTQLLADELGVNRNTMYREFGSKEGLFEASLDRYERAVLDHRFGPLEQHDAGLSELLDLFDHWAAAVDGQAYGKGCLYCNSAVELGALDPNGRDFTRRYFARIRDALHNALHNAQIEGELAGDRQIGLLADLLTSTTLGLFVLIRSKADPSMIRAVVAAAKSLLSSSSDKHPG
jgi:TetR/AcrR family transcriptional repressor of nem operon